MFCSSFLRKLVFGYCDEDSKSQLYYSPKSLKIEQQLFFDTVEAMCEGLVKLEDLEAGNADVVYEKSKHKFYLKLMRILM